MAEEAMAALDEAVVRFSNGDGQSVDILLATVSSAITVDCLQRGDELEVSRFHLSSPHISWRVKLQVESGDVLRVVLCEMAAENMSCLRVQGTIHIRRRRSRSHQDDDDDADDEEEEEEEELPPVAVQLSPPPSSSSARHHPLVASDPRDPIIVVTDGPATIASIHRGAVSDVRVTMATFYYHPRQRQDATDDDDGAAEEEAVSGGDDDDDDVIREREEDDGGGEGAQCDDGVLLQMLGRLSADLGHLLATQDAADVVLQLGSGAVKAHSAVLTARSEVFRQMLQGHSAAQLDTSAAAPPPSESPASAVTLQLTDVPHDAFLRVLHFMYTAAVDGLSGRETDVLVVAARFGLDDLADECCRRLLAALDRDNGMALDLLAFAERHDVRPLKERALLVAVHHLEAVTSSTRWCEYKRRMPSLAADLLETAARVLVLRRE